MRLTDPSRMFRFAAVGVTGIGVNMFFLSVIVAFIVVMVNVVITGQSRQWDTTSNRRHSLAPQSVSVVEALDDDIMVTAVSRGSLSDRDTFAGYFNEKMEQYRAVFSLK